MPGTVSNAPAAWPERGAPDSRLALILQLASVGIISLDGRIVAVNKPICDMLGFEAHELVGRAVSELSHPDDRHLGPDLMRQAIAGEIKTYGLEKRFIRKDGRAFWALISGTVICHPETGEPEYFASLIQDIDARKKAEQESDAAESRWTFALESAGQGVWDYRVKDNKTYYSATWKALIGYERGEISDAGDAWQAFVHPDDLSLVLAADKDHLAGLTPYFDCEFRMRHKQGHWVWIYDKGKVVERDADGRPLRMIGTHTDITALKKSEELLRETGARYRLLADNATDMILRVRKSGRRVYVSPACRRLLGWEPEEMLEVSTAGALHPHDVASLTETWTREFESEEALTLAYRMRRKEGSYVWVESISRALPLVEGKPRERLLIVRDIDQRVAAEQKMRDSEARYRLLAENASDMIFQLDTDLVRCYVSPACREILGYEPEDLLGAKPVAMAHPDDAKRVAETFQSVISGALERASLSNRIRHRDGGWLWVDAELRLLRDARTGAPSGIVGSLRDASKRKASEQRLKEDNRQLASQAARDGLTGLFNRRTFDIKLEEEFRRARRQSTMLGLIMIDVDGFKSYNDRYGHPAGDACLRAVSAAIESEIKRPGDGVARYGGEEFAVLLPNTGETGALEVAERIRLAVKRLGLEHADARDKRVTISAGVASIAAGAPAAMPSALVQLADRALYAAKQGGRDVVMAAAADPPRMARAGR